MFACSILTLFFLFGHSTGEYYFQIGSSANIPLINKDIPICARPMIASGEVPDQNIYVSSCYDDDLVEQVVKLRGRKKAWCARKDDVSEPWVRVDLGKVMLIAGINVGGKTHSYSVEYSPDGRIWSEIKDERGRTRHFKAEEELVDSGGKGAHEARANYQPFNPLIHARVVRVLVHAWARRWAPYIPLCVNLEIFACDSDWALTNIQQIEEQKSVKESDCHFLNPLGSIRYTRDWDVFFKNKGNALYRKNGIPFIERAYIRYNLRYSSRVYTWLSIDMKRRNFITNVKAVLIGVGVPYTWTYKHSLDGTTWHPFKLRKRTWSGKAVTYSDKPVPARHILVIPDYDSFSTRQFDVYVFGCSDEVQSLGPWSRSGRLTTNGIKVISGDKEKLSLTSAINGWCSKKPKYPIPAKGKFKFLEPIIRKITNAVVGWIEMDLKRLYAISHLLTRGNCKTNEAAAGLQLMHSLDHKTWIFEPHNENSNKPLLHITRLCRKCACRVTRTVISPTIYTRYLKIITKYGICLTVDVHGNNAEKPKPLKAQRIPGCNNPLGMQSNIIRDFQISASSAASNGKATSARLHSQGSWCVKKMAIENFYKLREYLLIDLKSEKIIDGFATQGNDQSRGREQWVTGYVVHYSIDKISWDVISTKEREKFFLGNTNRNGVVRHYLNPRIRARYIRFLPVTWNNWICMRVEIFGCDAGASTEEELERKLQDIEAERVDVIPLFPKREAKVFKCGQSAVLGKSNYIRYIADNTFWTEHVSKKEVPLFKSRIELTYHSTKLPSRAARRFTCYVKKEGRTLFRHHLLSVDYKSPSEWHHKARPQLLVFQPFDQAYNGGKIVWDKPAVVWVKGSIATIGVYVFGIVGKYKVTRKCLEKRRNEFWKYTFLGKVTEFGPYKEHYCRNIALHKGYKYSTVRNGNQCYSSWYLPLATKPGDDCSVETSTTWVNPDFKTHLIEWYKKNPRGGWKRLSQHNVVRNPSRISPRLYSSLMKDPASYQSIQTSFGRFHAYNQVSFHGDRAIATNILEILNVEGNDMGTYRFRIEFPGENVVGEAMIELRHLEEPRFSLPESFHVCEKVPKQLKVTMQVPSNLNPTGWHVKWYGIKQKNRMASEIRFLANAPSPLKLLYTAQSVDEIRFFEAEVSNRFGFALARSQVFVANASDVPYIVWVTKSPFMAIEGDKDVLEVRLSSDSNVKKIEWYHNGKIVDDTSNDFSFPGEFSGIKPLRKAVRFNRVTPRTAGQYRVVVNGTHCSFQETIVVSVLLRPVVIVEPLARFITASLGQSKLFLNATVKGGKPKPERDDMSWKKGRSTLIPTRRGRVAIAMSRSDEGSWTSVLTIKKLRYRDSGTYKFIVNTGPINVTILKEIKVLQGNSSRELKRMNVNTTAPVESRSAGYLTSSLSTFLVSNIIFLVLKYL